MYRFGVLLILPLLFLLICIIKGIAESASHRRKQNDIINGLLKNSPINWGICPEAKLRTLTFPENLKQGPWGYNVQVRHGAQGHIKVFYRNLGLDHIQNSLPPKGRLVALRTSEDSSEDVHHVFIPDDLIPEIDDFHSKVTKGPLNAMGKTTGTTPKKTA